MERIIAMLLCLALVLSTTACGTHSEKTNFEQPKDPTSETAKVPAALQQQEVVATTGATQPSESLEVTEIDFQYEIANFVPDPFNCKALQIGEKDMAPGDILLSSGDGSIYTSNENVVTVANNGVVTAVGEGTAYVLVAGMGGMHKITQYAVGGSIAEEVQPTEPTKSSEPTESTEPTEKPELPEVPGIDFQYEIDNFVPDYFNSKTLRIGEKDKAPGDVWLSGGAGSIYTSNANVVTVANNGAVTAVGEGTAYVLVVGIGSMHKITQYVVRGSIAVEVQPTEPTEKLELPEVPGIDFQYEIDNFVPDYFNSKTLRIGEKDMAQGYIWLSGGAGSIYTSNANVVTVANNGAVTAVGKGTAYVLVVGIGGMRLITQYVVK